MQDMQEKVILVITTILASVGSKYIHLEYQKEIEDILRCKLGRLAILFSILYVSTKDLQLSIIGGICAYMVLSMLPNYDEYYRENVSRQN